MAHPKRKHSTQRTRKRRTHFKTAVPNLSPCSNCQKPVITHRVCPFCGYYKGRPIVEIKPTEPKKA